MLCKRDIADKHIDVILGTVYMIPEQFINDVRYYDVLRLSEKIPQYRNYEIEKYRNKYNGRRCFIVATGPSLTIDDLNTLNQNEEICISMNDIYKIFNDTYWRPNFWCAIDSSYIDRCIGEIKENLKEVTVFLADGVMEYEEYCYETNMFWYHLGRQWSTQYLIPFSNDFAQIVYAEGTVTYACMQLAVYLGFETIYLLGVDATGINGNNQTYRHFFKEDTLDSICWSQQVLNSYRSAKKYADDNGIHIYNATRGGELEVFDRVDFDALF